MKKFLLGPVLGLALIISGLTVTTSANAFTLRNMYLGTCLGVAAGNPNTGSKLVLWQCDGTPSQNFTAVPTSYAPYTNSNGEALYTLYSGVAGNRVLGVAPVASGAVIAPVVTWTVDYLANQQWTMTPVYIDHQGHQCYAIRSNGTLTMLTPSIYNTSVGSMYVNNYYSAPGVLSSTIYGIPNGNWGKADQGDSVGASTYIYGAGFTIFGQWYQYNSPQLYAASFWASYGVHFVYDPQAYAAQYWCAY